jgi:hypothetical protein
VCLTLFSRGGASLKGTCGHPRLHAAWRFGARGPSLRRWCCFQPCPFWAFWGCTWRCSRPSGGAARSDRRQTASSSRLPGSQFLVVIEKFCVQGTFGNIWEDFWSSRMVEGLGIVVHICNPSTQEVETGKLRVRGQPGVHTENLSQTTTKLLGNLGTVVPATPEAEAGESLESRSSRPAWAT